MSAFKNHKFSLVRAVRALGPAMALKTGAAAPGFADLDAHAQLSDLPETDLIGVLGYACHYSGKLITVHISGFVSSVNDPGLVRHTEMMDVMIGALRPETRVQVYDAEAAVLTPVSWLFVQGDGMVDPVGRENTRSIQVLTIRLISGQTL